MTTQQEYLDTAIQKIGNRYLATMLIAKRIRQLAHGIPPRVEPQDGESLFSVAVREIAAGLLMLDEPSTETTEVSTNGITADETPSDLETPEADTEPQE